MKKKKSSAEIAVKIVKKIFDDPNLKEKIANSSMIANRASAQAMYELELREHKSTDILNKIFHG